MLRKRSQSTVESITSEFQLKFKDKINFVNKQGIICTLFESQTPRTPLQPDLSSTNITKTHLSARPTMKTELRVSMQKEERVPSLPKLKSTVSLYNESKNRTAKLERTSLNVFLLGLSGGPKHALGK